MQHITFCTEKEETQQTSNLTRLIYTLLSVLTILVHTYDSTDVVSRSQEELRYCTVLLRTRLITSLLLRVH